MVNFRGEEQSGFLELVGTWLTQQSWFQAAPGRRVITRVGGLRLPASQGDPDQGLHLELHIVHVDHSGGQARVAVPMALRSRPSALAGKTAFIGRLGTPAGDLWVYDGARDRAFLAAWHEMARRQQGSRNGRSRGEAFADFNAWPSFTAKLQRTALDAPSTAVARTAVTNEDEHGESRRTVVDFIRRPEPHRAPTIDAVVQMANTGSHTVSRVLGVVTGSWPETDPNTGDRQWVTGDLGIIREPSITGAPASALARTALNEDAGFRTEAAQIGRILGDFHADLAGAFGAYPQTSLQLEITNGRAADALEQAWNRVRHDFDGSGATEIERAVQLQGRRLRDADQVMSLQKIHGDLSMDHVRRADHDAGWIIDEDGGMMDHALPLRDLVSVLISLAELVMEASEQEMHSAGTETDTSGLDLGLWYEEITEEVLSGYRSSEADETSIDSEAFRAAMLTEALQLHHRSKGRWVFRPSMLRGSGA